MRTAAVVSGSARHLLNASSSWRFNADYYLVTDSLITAAQGRHTVGDIIPSLSNILTDSNISYAGLYLQIQENTTVPAQYLTLDPDLNNHPVVRLAWKWRTAYRIIQQQAVHYDRILLLRPDLYVWYLQSESDFDMVAPKPRTIHGSSGVFHDAVQNRPTMADTFLMMDLETFGTVSGFFDYFLTNYQLTLHQGYDLHTLLTKYIIEHTLTADSAISEYCVFAILRDNSTHMFNQNNRLLPEYSFSQLQDQQHAWWREKYHGQ
jgi:hypothetical protein